MTKATRRERLRLALQKSGSDWVFRYWGSEAERNLDRLAADLDQFVHHYRQRYGDRPDPVELLDSNPTKGAAFFQVDTLRASPEMKVLVWRLLLGYEITRLECHYRAGHSFRLKVTIRSPYGSNEESYESTDPSDFRILRHIGLIGVGDQTHLQGYYAARNL
jgi:hypothetical protein